MRTSHRAPTGWAAILFSGLLLADPVEAALSEPSCDAVLAWVQGFDRTANWAPNTLALGGRERFSARFADPSTTGLFGKPVLQWTGDEARSLAPLFARCAEQQRRGGSREAIAGLGVLRTQTAREVPAYLTALAEARAAAPRALAELDQTTPSVALLRFTQALGGLGTEADAGTRATQASTTLAGPSRAPARTLLLALRDLPAAEIGPVLAPVPARIEALRTGLLDGLLREIEAIPASLAGLQLLDRRLRELTPEYAPALGEPAMASVQEAANARRRAIGVHQRDEVLAQIAQVPSDWQAAPALERLRRQVSQTQGAAIGPEGMGTIDAAIGARRTAIGVELRDRLLADIDRTKPDPAGLRSLHTLETGAPRPEVLALLGEADLGQVRERAATQRATLGSTVAAGLITRAAAVPLDADTFAALDPLGDPAVLALLPPDGALQVGQTLASRRKAAADVIEGPFRDGLARLPETEESLVLLDREVLGEVDAWPASAAEEKARFRSIALERRGAIEGAVTRAEAGPLAGRIYEGPFGTLEFVDRSRVVMTQPGDAPAAGRFTEEPDGRVFVEVQGRSIVLTRVGRRLVAGPLELSRTR